MASSVNQITHSRFFIPSLFNGAIFDGPMRIYFNQAQEALALKVYFHVKDLLDGELETSPFARVEDSGLIYVLMYPETESYEELYAEQAIERQISFQLEDDFVMALNTSENLGELNFEDFQLALSKAPRAATVGA